MIADKPVTHGFVIRWSGAISSHTFAYSEGGAWSAFIGSGTEPVDRATVIQRWHDRGVRVAPAVLLVDDAFSDLVTTLRDCADLLEDTLDPSALRPHELATVQSIRTMLAKLENEQ